MSFNADLAHKVLDQIRAHPETWNQDWWISKTNCGTAYCFAGWACALSGWEPFAARALGGSYFTHPETLASEYAPVLAAKLLGLPDHNAEVLFSGMNTLEDLERGVADLEAGRPVSIICSCGCMDDNEEDEEEGDPL